MNNPETLDKTWFTNTERRQTNKQTNKNKTKRNTHTHTTKKVRKLWYHVSSA